MGEETKPNTLESIKIYDARLMFYPNKKIVRIQIRYAKKGHSVNETVTVDIPYSEEIKDSDLSWTTFEEEKVAVYHRKESYKYIDLKHNTTMPTAGLSQSLEKLVLEAHHRHLQGLQNKSRSN